MSRAARQKFTDAMGRVGLPETLVAQLTLVRIDDGAMNGKYQFVTDGEGFALAKWTEDGWAYPGGEMLDLMPTHYRPASLVIKPEGQS